jgi:hypothetical protein
LRIPLANPRKCRRERLLRLSHPIGHRRFEGDIQSLRSEVKEDIARMQTQLTEIFSSAMVQMQEKADRRTATMLERLIQTESDKRADTVLGRLEQKCHEASEQTIKSAAAATIAHSIPGVGPNQQPHPQPARNAQRTWANVTRVGTQTAAGWATVANRREKLRKYPLDQRRILFVRDSWSHHYNTR